MKKIILILVVVLGITSCSQDDYLVDGGLSDGNLGVSTMEFLKSHYQLDTLAILIEKAGLVDQVNGTSTLIAPNNLAIRSYVKRVLAEMQKTDPQAKFTFNDISVDTLHKYMGDYIFPEKIRREDMVKEGKIYTAINGSQKRISLEPVAQYTGQLSDFPEYVYYTYKLGDEWDEWDKIKDDIRIQVRTSNLISTNGVIHVLQGSHKLFNYSPVN
jgi:hypothetical protein